MKIGKLKSKYLIIEISTFLSLEVFIQKLWQSSSDSRKLIINNFEIIKRLSNQLGTYITPSIDLKSVQELLNVIFRCQSKRKLLIKELSLDKLRDPE